MARSRFTLVWLLLGSIAAASGCAVNRRPLTKHELECRRLDSLEIAGNEQQAGIDKIVRRMLRKQDDYASGRSAEPPVFDVLVISGGGDKGAFAAGFLAGWSSVQGPLARPKFDIVTGVSTGAIIAPFAFADDSLADARILQIYRQPQKDWAQMRDWFFFLPGRESFVDPTGLKRDLSREINRKLIFAMAKGAAEDRLLAVGTTNLDLGLSHTWDLTEEAYKAFSQPKEAHAFDRLHDILQASAAIPALFPPVVIDDALHVDGGTTSNILIVDDLRSPDTPRHVLRRMGVPIPKLRYWIVINNRLTPEARLIQPSWISITEASVDTMIRSSELITLRFFAEQVDYVRQTEPDVDIELRFVAIPDSWSPAKAGLFQPENMQALAAIGLQMGLDPASWRTELARTAPNRPAASAAAPEPQAK